MFLPYARVHGFPAGSLLFVRARASPAVRLIAFPLRASSWRGLCLVWRRTAGTGVMRFVLLFSQQQAGGMTGKTERQVSTPRGGGRMLCLVPEMGEPVLERLGHGLPAAVCSVSQPGEFTSLGISTCD